LSPTAVALVLTAAVSHAIWNMLVRRGSHREAFAWWMALSAGVLYLPVGAYLWATRGVPGAGWPFVAVTVVVHAFYFVFLGRGYEHGHLGLVYPIARGTGPVLVPVLAVPLLGERITPFGAAGIGLIVVGVVSLSAGGFTPRALRTLAVAVRDPAALYALATGATIAVYSVNDKVGAGWISPVLYAYLLFAGASVLAAPYFWLGGRRDATRACWCENRRSILLAGLLSPATYGLALIAFQLGQVSYLAPMRELSIVFAALLGMLVLGEPRSASRLASACVTAAGVVVVGVAG
jgi:drug/metabolite transporter (DMT)-like permease